MSARYFTLQTRMENSEFESADALADALETVIYQLRSLGSESPQGYTRVIQDTNGNTVGTWRGHELERPEGATPQDLVGEPRDPLAFKAGDDVVSWFEDEAGVWTMLELTEEGDEGMEWSTAATLLLSDVEAADLARRLTDRTAS